MSRNKVDELVWDAVRQAQRLAKDQGFKRQPDQKAFMDDMSGEDDGPRIILRRRFTKLSDADLAKARIWWEGLSEGEKMRRRDDAASRREAFGIELPDDDDDEDWPHDEGWAAVCYDDERA